ncbi:cobalamin-dependent protein [Desulfosporosinus sp. Sb-LF]|uniref:cobalamin B12-binding domain-containing protein n=1 Tax=Desulfosporosinus sp. Sb-LF TaxID=2560027 RepID=UPI00107F9B9A|nr:cobalamin-dependent protein [Desulfosporosinus sp. Sb-LF]TGE33737.1 cobalamin-binding protein [Desulfosporosinus sp. Sb-LF]
MNKRAIKILLAKAGMDNQDKEIRILARGLREQGGMDVIYTGLYCSLEEIAATALREAVDLVGLFVHNGSHLDLYPRLHELLVAQNVGHVPVFGGGLIPERHRQELKAQGAVTEIFGPGTSTGSIIAWINQVLTAGEGGEIV